MKNRKKEKFVYHREKKTSTKSEKDLVTQSSYVMEKTNEFVTNLLDEGIHPMAIETVIGKAWMTLIKARCRGDIPNAAATALTCLKKMIFGMTIAELQRKTTIK